MSPLITSEHSGHWYSVDPDTKEIRPEYETAQGTKTTLTVARKQHFLPSVTNVLSVIAKPELEAWKQEQCVLSALTLPRLVGEPLDDYARRCVHDSQQQSKTARDLGSDIHADIEAYLKHGTLPEEATSVYVYPFIEWVRHKVEKIIGVEQYVADTTLGYAGKYDSVVLMEPDTVFDSKKAVLDVKCRKCKNGMPSLYWEDPVQLAAYAHALDGENVICLISVIIDTTTPGKFYLHEWLNFESSWQNFQHCHALWCSKKNYNPGMI